jgi:hypothetical protein
VSTITHEVMYGAAASSASRTMCASLRTIILRQIAGPSLSCPTMAPESMSMTRPERKASFGAGGAAVAQRRAVVLTVSPRQRSNRSVSSPRNANAAPKLSPLFPSFT